MPLEKGDGETSPVLRKRMTKPPVRMLLGQIAGRRTDKCFEVRTKQVSFCFS